MAEVTDEPRPEAPDGGNSGMPAMTVRVRLFAWLRDWAGTDVLELSLAPGATAEDASRSLFAHPRLNGAAEVRGTSLLAVNQEYAEPGHVLQPGDELALVPPVSGGAIHVRVTEEPLELERLSNVVATPRTGAVAIFQGMTRDVERLHYEAYIAMAERRITAIASDVVKEHKLEGLAIEHRTGDVPRGEPSVIVVAAAVHRADAFAAAHATIDRIKAEAPIWKLEIDGDWRSWAPGVTPSGGSHQSNR